MISKPDAPEVKTIRRRTPYRQGDLDQLCGVYSVINAARALCPEVDDESARVLFSLLLDELNITKVDLRTAITIGIGARHLMQLTRKAAMFVSDEFDIRLTIIRMPRPLRLTASFDSYWQWLNQKMTPTSAAILGLSGRRWHWTVAVTLSTGQMQLFDCSDMSVLQRRHCTLDRRARALTTLWPQHTVLIRRIEK